MEFKYINTTCVLSAEEYNKIYKDKKDYLFNDQLNGIIDRINTVSAEMIQNNIITDQYSNKSINSNTYQFNNKSNNTISIVGERGSGKSSLMGTVANILNEDGYFVLNPIDPSIFNDSLSVLEIFLSHIIDHLSNSNHGNKHRVNQIYHQVKMMMRTLSTLRLSKEKLVMNTEETEFILSINNQINFDKEMRNLVSEFTKLINEYDQNKPKCKGIIICIDDLDMVENDCAYQMIENIRNYLSDHVITIIAYREKQLLDIIIDNRIKVNKVLLDREIIDINEIRSQSFRYLEKIIPMNNRFNLLEGSGLLNKNISNLLKSLIVDYDEETFKRYMLIPYKLDVKSTVLEWLNAVNYKKLRIPLEPVDSVEFTNFNIPQNLRGLLQLLQWMQESLNDLPSYDLRVDLSDRTQTTNCLRQNLELYKKNLISYSSKVMEYEDITFINRWINSSVAHKNYVAYMELSNRLVGILKKEDTINNKIHPKLQGLLDINYVQYYNITILDIYNILEEYKTTLDGDPIKLYLIYLIKQLYSIQLLEAVTKIDDGNYIDYLDIINGQIFDEDTIKFPNHNWFATYTDDNRIEKMFDQFGYTMVSKDSDILKVARMKRANVSMESYQLAFRSYQVFSDKAICGSFKNNELNQENDETMYVSSRKYKYNPFSIFTKTEYLEDIKEKNYRGGYIFYSIFDLDILNRINFARRTEKNPMGYVLRKINRIFNGELQTTREYELSKEISKNPYHKRYLNQEINYDIFSDELINTYSQLIDIDIKKGGIDEKHIKKFKSEMKNLEEYGSIPKNEVKNLISYMYDEGLINKLNVSTRSDVNDMMKHLEKNNSRVRIEDKKLLNNILSILVGE